MVGTSYCFGPNRLFGENGEKGYFRSLIITQVKTNLAEIIKEENIPILEIDAALLRLSELLMQKINGALEAYGLEITDFFINRILTPDEDPNYRRLKDQYAQQYLLIRQEEIRRREAEAAAERKAVEAQTQAKLKLIEAHSNAEALKLQAAAEAVEMRMKGYTYQEETARLVGLEAMKNDLGNGSGGTSVLGEIAGLGVGLSAMNGVMNMAKNALAPMMEKSAQTEQTAGSNMQPSWDCTCGQTGNTGNFCSNCGKKRGDEQNA